MITIRITDDTFDPLAELARFEREAHDGMDVGASASFVGRCRGARTDGAARVRALELEYYPGFTEKEIARLAEDIVRRYGLSGLLVIHRVGAIAPGEAIVLVGAQSGHRAEAFNAVERMMDYLKTDGVFWKREIDDDGAHWIEPTQKDYSRRERYED